MHEDVGGDPVASEEREKYSTKIDAEYEIPGTEIKNSTSINLKEPTILVVLGLFLQIFKCICWARTDNRWIYLGLLAFDFTNHSIEKIQEYSGIP